MAQSLNRFVIVDSVYGRFLLNRHCAFQAETMIKTGLTHIESELAKIFVLCDCLPQGCVIVDGGANAGFFAVPVAQRIRSKKGHVICFEPQRQIFYGLCGTVAMNDLDNVRVNCMALSDRIGTAVLPEVDYDQPQDFGTVSVSQNHSVASMYDCVVSQRSVQTIALDDLALPRLDLVKLDVEGFELTALQGSKRSINQHRPFLWVEYWLTGLDPLKDFVLQFDGYQTFVMDELNVLFAPVEKLQQYDIKITTG